MTAAPAAAVEPERAPGAPSLPWAMVRLKARLLRNRARGTGAESTRLVVSLAATAFGGGLVGLLVAALAASDDAAVAEIVLVLGATGLTVGWAVLPLLSFGVDETLDPGRLVLFPLRRAPLTRGLLAASLVGVAPLGVLLVVAGAAVGWSRHGNPLITLPALTLLVLLSAATARTLSTLLAAGLTSRRGRDATVIAAGVLVIGVQGLRFLALGDVDASTFDPVVDVARWTPPGMLGQAVLDGADGRPLVALLQMVPALALVPLLLHVWGRALERSLTVVTAGETGARRARSGQGLLGGRLDLAGRGPWGAAAARELRYFRRDPRRKLTLVTSVLLGAGIPLWFSTRGGGLDQRSVLLASLAGFIALLASNNQIGFDGRALWIDAVSGRSLGAVLAGKNVATAIVVLPIVTVVGAGIAATTGGWAYLPAAVGLALAGLAAGLATADVVSVRFPVRLPESQNPFSGSGGGQGCTTSLVLSVCWLVQSLLLAPVLAGAGIALVVGGWAFLVVVPLSLAYGLGLWRLGLHVAARIADGRLPELLTEVDPTQAG